VQREFPAKAATAADALTTAAGRGDLLRVEDGGRVRWRWRDTLEEPVPETAPASG